jgi:uncharacterized protein YndB with AHSA1/START domain
MSDRIERVVEIDAPVARVWRALVDHREFGRWFRVELDQPFAEGALSTGRMTMPGFAGWPWRAMVTRIEPETSFAFRWHDFDPEAGRDVADQPTTLVEFTLAPTARGTRLTVTESGFAAIPEPRRIRVMRDNAQGWAIQTDNLAAHVAAHVAS